MDDTNIRLPEIDDSLCDGCEACVDACSLEALVMVNHKAVFQRAQACDYCGECEAACSAGAIVCPFEVVLADMN